MSNYAAFTVKEMRVRRLHEITVKYRNKAVKDKTALDILSFSNVATIYILNNEMNKLAAAIYKCRNRRKFFDKYLDELYTEFFMTEVKY